MLGFEPTLKSSLQWIRRKASFFSRLFNPNAKAEQSYTSINVKLKGAIHIL